MNSERHNIPVQQNLGTTISEFCLLVEKEIKAFSRLLSALSRQQALIPAGNLDDLKETITEEERLISLVRSLRKDRLAKTEVLADALSLSSGEVTLSTLVRSVGNQYAERLDELRSTLSALVAKIDLLSRDNRFLIERSLNLVERNLQILARVGLSDPFYPPAPVADRVDSRVLEAASIRPSLRLVDTRG